jgi:hypothetical protein
MELSQPSNRACLALVRGRPDLRLQNIVLLSLSPCVRLGPPGSKLNRGLEVPLVFSSRTKHNRVLFPRSAREVILTHSVLEINLFYQLTHAYSILEFRKILRDYGL